MRTVIDLSEKQLEKLNELSRRQARSRASLIREAISEYVGKHALTDREAAFGLWKDRAVDGVEYQRSLRDEWQ